MRLRFLGVVAIVVLTLSQGVLPAYAQTWEECTECEGKGWIICLTCHGSGSRQCPSCGGDGMTLSGYECSFCDGTGRRPCYCSGTGIVECSACQGRGGDWIGETQPMSQPQQTDGTSSWGIAALAIAIVAVIGVIWLALTRKKS